MTIDEIRDNFALLDDWDDRYRYVIELGRTLEPMPEAAHSAHIPQPTRSRAAPARFGSQNTSAATAATNQCLVISATVTRTSYAD